MPDAIIDLRSDTVTRPTPAMRKAMAEAEVGDDGYDDDPTVTRLELKAAELMGKEAALFVPSGSFGNQLALFTHCSRGSEVILPEDCHIVQHEAGAPAIIAGVQLLTVATTGGCLSPDEVAGRIHHPVDYHAARTSLVCAENAHSNGTVCSVAALRQLRNLCAQNDIPLHLDGARVFNAAISLGVTAKDIADQADSVMFCLSKGLSAPVGSLLAGSADFVAHARVKRRIMGGQLRQAGVLAAAGLVAFDEVLPRLAEDHEKAKMLARSLSSIPELDVLQERTMVNMVFFRIIPPAQPGSAAFDPLRLVDAMKAKGIRLNPPMDNEWRLVTHREVRQEDIGLIAVSLREALKETLSS